MVELPQAEDLNYWNTSNSDPGTWLRKAESVIEDLGGAVQMSARGRTMDGREGFLVDFSFGEQRFRAVWPVLETRSGNELAARRQAATMLYHDVKSRALRCRIFGPRIAFFECLLLPDGRMSGSLADDEMQRLLPGVLAQRQLQARSG